MRGCGNFASAARFRWAFDELRSYFRSRCLLGVTVSLAQQRRIFRERFLALQALIAAAS